MKTYKLYISRASVVFMLLFLTILTLLVPVLFLLNFDNPNNRPPGFLIIPWLLIMAWNWWAYLRIPYQIKVFDDGGIEFKSLIQNTVIRNADMFSIRPYGGKLGWGNGFYVIKHRNGKIHIIQQFTGFYEFLSLLKSTNPNFQIIGC